MQTICIIIVKWKLNYVKNEVIMTDYDSSLEVETVLPKPVLLNRAISPAHNNVLF